MTMKVLLIEDDRQTAEHISFHLRSNGYEVEESYTGPDGEARARKGGHEALIVDRMLPGKDGLSVVRSLRQEGLQTPILFLTTMVSITDRVQGLEGGADDYLTKPFAAAELIARLNAITRRSTMRPSTLMVGSLEMDLVRHTLKRDGRLIELQHQEFHLMEYLMLNAGRVVTRAMLLENVWNLTFMPRTNLIETHISRLRSKIGCNSCNELIRTIRGSGYILNG
jgi:two-component system, OmpR family, response regulator